MFKTSRIQKFLSYFTAPYLDYRANKKALLLRKWPFYIERDHKKSATYSLYGTLFTSSRWSAASSLNISDNTNVVQEAVAEQPNSLFWSFILSPLNLINLFTSRRLPFLLVLAYFVFFKAGLVLTLPKTLLLMDPDFIYELHAAQYLLYLYVSYVLRYLIFEFEYKSSQLRLKLLGTGRPELTLNTYTAKRHSSLGSRLTRWYNSGHDKPERSSLCTGDDRGFDERVAGEKIKLVGKVTINPTIPTKKSTLTVDELLYSTLLSTSYYIQSVTLNTPKLAALVEEVKLGFLGLASGYSNFLNSSKVNTLFHRVTTFTVGGLSRGAQQPQLSLTSLGQPGYLSKYLGWLGFWSPTIASNSVKQTTDSVQEGRWLVHSFPSTSNLYENSKLFTSSKLAIFRVWAKSGQSSIYNIDRYKSKRRQKSFKTTSNSTTLNEQHFGFFETSRFFADARNYNLTGLTSYISNILYATYKSAMNMCKPKENVRLSSQLTELARPILNEPYIVRTPGGVCGRPRNSKIISAPNSTTRYVKSLSSHTHKSVKPFTATSSDLAFHELINTTFTSSSLNGSVPHTYVNHTIPEPTKILFKARSYPVATKSKKLS